MSRPHIFHALPALLVVASACATTSGAGRRATITRFDAPGPGAATYDSSPPAGESLRGPLAAKMRPHIEAGGAARGLTLRADPRLGELALWVAQHMAQEGRVPPAAAIDLVAHHLGMPEPTPVVIVRRGGDEETFGEALEGDVRGSDGQPRYTHYGAASLDRGEGPLLVVALSWRHLTLAPIPRAVDVGARVELRATIDRAFQTPQVVLTAPDGSVMRGQPSSTAELAMTLPTNVPGQHRVEVLARGERGGTVLANFPLYVGVPPVTHIDVQDEGADEGLSPEATNARLLELINGERARAGLEPLTLDPQLSEVARRHSVDMREHDFVGHRSPTTGEVADRVKAAGIRSPLIMENVGRGYGATGVHQGLMDSPGHREAILSPDATHVGIGTVVTGGDEPAYLVTEVFTHVNPIIDPDDAPGQLLDIINRARTGAGLPEVDDDEDLSELCAATAARYFSEPSVTRAQLLSDLNRKATASPAGRAYGAISSLLTTVDDLEAAGGIRQLLDRQATHVAIGVAQGTRPDGMPNTIALVVLVAQARR